MQAEIKFTPQEGAKSVNKAMVRSYDAQGIMVSEDTIRKAAEEGGEDQLQVTIDVPRNGSIRIESESTMVSDPEQKAAVPPEVETSDEIKAELKKKEEDAKKRREESLYQAALERGVTFQPPPRYPGEVPESVQKERDRASQGPAQVGGAHGGTPHMEHKDQKVDASKNPSTTPASGQPVRK